MNKRFDLHAGGHAHPAVEDEGPPGEFEIMSLAMQALLEARGIITAEDIRRRIEIFETDFPFRGSRVVARAWMDADYKQRLLADGRMACTELGITLESERLIAVENTPTVHNLVVCTLCSCYPRALMGMPPSWYKSREYRSRAVSEPRAVLREFGTDLPLEISIRVHDSNADMRYIVIPMRPAGTEGWSEDKLAALLTRDTLVGVTVPKVPGT